MTEGKAIRTVHNRRSHLGQRTGRTSQPFITHTFNHSDPRWCQEEDKGTISNNANLENKVLYLGKEFRWLGYPILIHRS